MKKIELSKILDKHLEAAYIISGEKISDKYITPLYTCMQEVWNLAVDKCNENVQINRDTYPDSINKNSILQVKKMIK
jgi:superfamily I DNA and/or RNA helicase